MCHALYAVRWHSLRTDSDSEVCIITRTADVSKWKEVLLQEHPVRGVAKIMSVGEFERTYTTQGSRIALAELLDLFILHPAVVFKVASKLVPFLRNSQEGLHRYDSYHDFAYLLTIF